MPDDITQSIPVEADPQVSPGGIKGFLGSKAGKVILIGAAVGLLALVGAVVAVVLLFSAVDPNDVVITPVAPASQTATSTAPGASLDTTTVPPPVPDSEIFTFRDIFKPLIVKAAETPPTTPGSDPATSTVDGEADTLYLQDVISEDGTDKAVLTYNGAEYRLGEGEVVTGTPWKVLSIDSSSESVVMLYGDTQVNLTVGQGTSSGK